MNTSEQQLDRIKLLVKYWETVDPKTVNLETWTCGTQACLAGHAAQIPEFNADGFVLNVDYSAPVYKNFLDIHACVKFFGVENLFECRHENYPYANQMNDYQLAATRMREYLYERGVR